MRFNYTIPSADGRVKLTRNLQLISVVL